MFGESKVSRPITFLEYRTFDSNGFGSCTTSPACDMNPIQIKKSFKFLNFWTKHPTFIDVVRQHWYTGVVVNSFVMFHHMLKNMNVALTQWRKETYGDIFQQIATAEDVIKAHEIKFEMHPTLANREKLHKVQDELIKFLHLEEEFWRQKAGMQWFQDGDRNTKFFHAQVQGRRRTLHVHRTQDGNGNWLESMDDITNEAIRFLMITLKSLAQQRILNY